MIYKNLAGGKTVPRKCPDMRDRDKTLVLETEFSKVYKTPEGIGGTIKHGFQQKVPYSEDQYEVVNPSITFFVIPDHKIIILHGTGVIRDKVIKTIEEALSGNIGYINDFQIKKRKQDAFVNKILAEDISNKVNMRNNTSDGLDDHDGIEGHKVTMHKGICATTIPRYDENREKASSFDCKLELVKCSGLIDERIEKPLYLTINQDMSFVFGRNITSKQWNRFILHKCIMLFS